MESQFDTRQETSLRDFLDVLFRRKWIIISIFLVATGLVVFLNARQPRIWESSSRVLVRRGEQGSVLSGNVRYLGWEEEVASEIQVILSEDVFARARTVFADPVRIKGYPADWKFNSGAVRAEVVGESNAFVIRYSDVNPAVVRLGCEAVTMGYHDFYRKRKNPPELSDFFAAEIEDVRTELDNWRMNRQKFMDESKFYGSNETSRFLLNRISSLEQRREFRAPGGQVGTRTGDGADLLAVAIRPAGRHPAEHQVCAAEPEPQARRAHSEVHRPASRCCCRG
jgi:hypothetical protein